MIKKIILIVLILCSIWFIFFKTTKLSISYDGLEQTYDTTVKITPSYKRSMSSMDNINLYANNVTEELAIEADNSFANDSLYIEDAELSESDIDRERYRENYFYRVDTESFDYLLDDLMKIIDKYNGTIKINSQNSNRKIEFGNEFYPRYQNIEFVVNNIEENIEDIELVLKKWGSIHISNNNKTSIEQELIDFENRLKELEEARKALKESKDQDNIARRDSELAKNYERIQNQIEQVKKESTYKTYTINLYEIIYFNVNSIIYWYSNNYELKNAVANSLPKMIDLFAILIPITMMLLILILLFNKINENRVKKMFEQKIKMLKEEFNDLDIHFDMKV